MGGSGDVPTHENLHRRAESGVRMEQIPIRSTKRRWGLGFKTHARNGADPYPLHESVDGDSVSKRDIM